MYLVVNSGRMVQKIITNTGTPYAVAPSGDHTDGSWLPYHLYDGEFGILSAATPDLALRISGTIYHIPLAATSGSPTLPTGTSAQTLRYDAGGTLVANSILKNDGTDVFVGAGTAGTGRLLSTINHISAHNLILKNVNAGGLTYIEFQNSAGAEQYDIGMNGGDLQINNAAGLGISLDTTAIAQITQNSAGIHQILILQNLNSSAPVYLTFLNAASAEKFYVGYRQAQTRFDILSADTVVGLVVDNNGRTGVGVYNSAYFAPDTGSVLTVETRADLTSYGMTMRHVANFGADAPIRWQYTNTGTTLVYYASIDSDIVSNANSAHYGNLIFQVAVSGVMTTRMVIDSSGITTGTWLGTTIAVAKGGTNKTGIAANRMLVALTTDTYTETPFFDVAEQVMATTPTFTAGTAPSGATTHTYRWDQVGNRVTVRITLVFATAGATVTGCLIPKPADIPDPAVPNGFSGAGAIYAYGAGGGAVGISNVTGNIAKSYIKRNAGNTGFEFGIDMTTGSSKIYYVNITYYTT